MDATIGKPECEMTDCAICDLECSCRCETAEELAAKYQAQLELQQRGQAKLEAVRKMMR